MKYLFDTDVISALMKRKASEKLLKRLAALSAEAQAISSLTVFEIYHGAYRSPDPEKYVMLFEANVLPTVDVIPFDDTAARIAGRTRAERERRGKPISPTDLRIASIALASGRILVTGNVRHFEDIPGLDVQNWLQ